MLTPLDPEAPDAPPAIRLGEDKQGFSASDWSPDGRYLAYISPSPGDPNSGEIYLIAPDGDTDADTDADAEPTPTALTDFAADGGLMLGGQTPGGLRWSPDGQKLAFWTRTADDMQTASLYVIDLEQGAVRHLCGLDVDLSEQTITPDPPAFIWSWDSAFVAFGANPPDDLRGTLLIAVNIRDGVYIELSDGLTSAPGGASVVAWGRLPGR